jgi:hypothetical protein
MTKNAMGGRCIARLFGQFGWFGLYLSMKHAKPARGIGIVPQGDFVPNWTSSAPC